VALALRVAAIGTHSTPHQQNRDIVVVQFGVYQRFDPIHSATRTVSQNITQTFFRIPRGNRVSQAIGE
jgi:hypothetical protein